MLSLPGKKVTLRDIQSDDLAVLDIWLRGEQEWKKLNAPYYPAQTDDEVTDLLNKMPQRITSGAWPTPRNRLAIAKNADDQIIGMVTWYWISEESQWPAAGIVLYDPANWQQGYGYEALRLWGGYLFESYPQFARLDLQTWSGNHGMMRLAEKLGYRQEACFRKARIVDGTYYDGLGYGMLREEWAALTETS